MDISIDIAKGFVKLLGINFLYRKLEYYVLEVYFFVFLLYILDYTGNTGTVHYTLHSIHYVEAVGYPSTRLAVKRLSHGT